MNHDTEHTAEASPAFPPYAGTCYGNGWRQMWKYILELLLLTIISIVITIPSSGFSAAEEASGLTAFYLVMLVGAWVILVEWPVEYGLAFAFLKAARGEKPKVADIMEVQQNYVNTILANLLVVFIVGIGFMLLIIPGIVFACKLAFVPYLVVERRMDTIQAVKTSWRMTTGHAFTVFLIGLMGFFLAIAGLVVFIVGIFVAVIWIRLASASLYHSVSAAEGATV